MMIDLRSKGIKDFTRLVPAIRRNLLITMKVFGNAAERSMRNRMRSGKYAKKSPPWAAATAGRPVLYNTKHLSTLIKNRVVPGAGPIFCSVEVGFLDPVPHTDRGGGNVQKIVENLQRETSWNPTQEQADAFWAKIPPEWKNANTPFFKEEWTSPARPFIRDTAYDPAMIALLHKHVDHAIERALKGK
jgi:hypothetical protein